MLKVLLCITSGVLSQQPPDHRSINLGVKLAQPIFQVYIFDILYFSLLALV